MAEDRVLAEKAKLAGREYITPEDVQEAVNEGVNKLALCDELLAILGKQRDLGAEDSGLCAFIAHRYEKQS